MLYTTKQTTKPELLLMFIVPKLQQKAQRGGIFELFVHSNYKHELQFRHVIAKLIKDGVKHQLLCCLEKAPSSESV